MGVLGWLFGAKCPSMILFSCHNCKMPLEADKPGTAGKCPGCKARIEAPPKSTRAAVGTPDKPVKLKATKIGNNTFSINCPFCGAKRNFRRSSIGTTIRCNECKAQIVLS